MANLRNADPYGPTLIENKGLRGESKFSYYKEISISMTNLVKSILFSRSVKSEVEAGRIVHFKIEEGTSLKLITSPIFFYPIDRKEKVNSANEYFPSELPLNLIIDSARSWIQINRALLKDNLCLIDAHHDNFAFNENLNPVWIDLGSIQKISHGLEGISEFRSFFEYPIKAINRYSDLSVAIRTLLNTTGISRGAWKTLSRIPLFSFKQFGLLSGGIRFTHKLIFGIHGFPPMLAKIIRLIALNWLNLSLPKKTSVNGYWGHYSRNLTKDIHSERENLVASIVGQLDDWVSVLDVAGFDGNFLLKINSVDKHLYLNDAEERGLNNFISFIKKGNFIEKSRNKYFGLLRRFDESDVQYDVVLALAISHHLALSQWWNFNGISKRLSDITLKYLIVEFMPNGVGKFQTPYYDLPIWYTEENFKNSLAQNFSEIIKVGEFENRVMFLAAKKGFDIKDVNLVKK